MDNETKWTPGEWEIEHFPNGEIMIVGDVRVVSDDEEHAKTVIKAQRMSEANAHLIAAAPCLYEALDDLIHYCDEGELDRELVIKVRAALAKARGEECG